MTVRVEHATPGDDSVAIPIEEEVLAMLSDALDLKLAEAHARGKVIRHVGRIDVKSGEVRLRLEELDPAHAFAQLQGPELCVRFFTERYAATPLTVQGPLFAAGTASGCFAELLRVVRHCSGHDRPTYSYLRRTPSMATIF
jgi:homoserine dehydrogenase